MTASLPLRRFAAVVLAGLAGMHAAGGADQPPKVSTGGIQLGPAISGPQLPEKGFEGRVVLLELWGMRCPPCATTMPVLEKVYRTLGPLGLVVIGAHVHDGTPEDVRRAAAALGVTFPIVGQTNIEGLGRTPQMPYTLLFDHNGKCVFAGSAHEVTGPAMAAIDASPPPVLDGRTLEKLVSIQPLLRNEASYGAALRKAKALSGSKDAQTAEEAAFVVGKLEAWGRSIIDKAPELRGLDPARAMATLQQCATAFKGDEMGSEAMRLVVEWKKDPTFQAAQKCGQSLVQLESLRRMATGGSNVVAPDVAASLPPAVKRQMKDLADKIQRDAPGSRMAERAAEIGTEFSLHDAGR